MLNQLDVVYETSLRADATGVYIGGKAGVWTLTTRATILCATITLLTPYIGGEGGIRTHATLSSATPLAGEPLKPLEYLSKNMVELVGNAPTWFSHCKWDDHAMQSQAPYTTNSTLIVRICEVIS